MTMQEGMGAIRAGGSSVGAPRAQTVPFSALVDLYALYGQSIYGATFDVTLNGQPGRLRVTRWGSSAPTPVPDWWSNIRYLGLNGNVVVSGNHISGTVREMIGQHTNLGNTYIEGDFTPSQGASQAPISSALRSPSMQFQSLRGLGASGEEAMQLTDLQLASGLGSLWAGLGIAGPYGQNPSSKVDAGTYEISGTQVALRTTPGGAYVGGDASNSSFNNAYGANGNLVVPPPDQVDFDGQTGTAQGLTWAHVTVKSGALQGKTGYVAIEYMAPVGWTASHNGTGPAQGGGGGGITPASDKTSSTTETDYTPYILAAAATVGGSLILWAIFAKPKHGARRHRRRHA